MSVQANAIDVLLKTIDLCVEFRSDRLVRAVDGVSLDVSAGEIGLTMTRSERFDASFFVDVPNLHSRCTMLSKWLKRHIADSLETANVIAEQTHKFSGADLRAVVNHAVSQADYEHRSVSLDHLRDQVERKRLRAHALYDQFEELRRWARMYCEPAGPAADC